MTDKEYLKPWKPNAIQIEKISMISAMLNREKRKDEEIIRLNRIINDYKTELKKSEEIKRLNLIIDEYSKKELDAIKKEKEYQMCHDTKDFNLHTFSFRYC